MHKLTWFAWLLIIGLLLSPGMLVAWDDDDDDNNDNDNNNDSGSWIVSKGKGGTQRAAVADAHVKAMMKYLKENVDSDNYDQYVEKIEPHVKSNWKNYCVTDPDSERIVVGRYKRRTLKVRIRIDGDALIKDVERFWKGGAEMAGNNIVIKIDPDRTLFLDYDSEPSRLDREIMMAQMQERLQKSCTVANAQELDNQLRQQAAIYGLDPNLNEQEVMWRMANLYQWCVFMWVKCTKRGNALTGQEMWYAQIGCRALKLENRQEVKWIVTTGEKSKDSKVKTKGFPVGGMGSEYARQNTIKMLADLAAYNLLKTFESNRTVVSSDKFTLRFMNFERDDRSKIQEALNVMVEDKVIKMERGGQSSESVFEKMVKYLGRGGPDGLQDKLRGYLDECEMGSEFEVRSAGSGALIEIESKGSDAF